MSAPIKGMKACHNESSDMYWVEDGDGNEVACLFEERNPPTDAAAEALANQFAASGEVLEAALALQSDMIRRAEIERDYRDAKETVVAAGDGVWRNFCAALALSKGEAS